MTNLPYAVSNMPKAVTKLVAYRIKKIGKENDSDQSRRLTRGEKVAKNMNIPYSLQFIIDCSMEEFNDILNNKSLDNEQIILCRNIRRRGKNKVMEMLEMLMNITISSLFQIAAQNCRKRKIDQISELEEELGSVRSRKRNLLEESEKLMLDYMEWMVVLDKLERHILERLDIDKDKEWELRVTCVRVVEVVENC